MIRTQGTKGENKVENKADIHQIALTELNLPDFSGIKTPTSKDGLQSKGELQSKRELHSIAAKIPGVENNSDIFLQKSPITAKSPRYNDGEDEGKDGKKEEEIEDDDIPTCEPKCESKCESECNTEYNTEYISQDEDQDLTDEDDEPESEPNISPNLSPDASPNTSPNTSPTSASQSYPALSNMVKTGLAGKGTYGVVYTAISSNNPTQKLVVKKNIIDQTTNFSGSLKELDILGRLKGHPFIIDLLSVSFGNPFASGPMSPIADQRMKEDRVHFIFEEGICDCHQLIYKKQTPIGYFKLGMVQTLLALEYMHSKGVIHRDIKPSNLLWFVVGTEKYMKICDFGMSKPITPQGTQTPRVVTSWYRAPEICLYDPYYNTKSDMWSVGCVFFEMVAKKALMHNSGEDRSGRLVSAILNLLPKPVPQDTLNRMSKGAEFTVNVGRVGRRNTMMQLVNLNKKDVGLFNQPYSSDVPNFGSYAQFLDLLDHLLTFDPLLRYNATQALDHPFFESYKYYIDGVRQNFPPVAVLIPRVAIRYCSERRWGIRIAFSIFNDRDNYPWYKHRILFQCIDLFDRFLVSQDKEPPNRFTVHLQFMVCLYVAIKYLTSSMQIPIPFTQLVTDEFKTESALEYAEDFETTLVKDILNFQIYRETVFECASFYLTDTDVRDLMIFYGLLDSHSVIGVTDLFTGFLKSRDKGYSTGCGQITVISDANGINVNISGSNNTTKVDPIVNSSNESNASSATDSIKSENKTEAKSEAKTEINFETKPVESNSALKLDNKSIESKTSTSSKTNLVITTDKTTNTNSEKVKEVEFSNKLGNNKPKIEGKTKVSLIPTVAVSTTANKVPVIPAGGPPALVPITKPTEVSKPVGIGKRNNEKGTAVPIPENKDGNVHETKSNNIKTSIPPMVFGSPPNIVQPAPVVTPPIVTAPGIISNTIRVVPRSNPNANAEISMKTPEQFPSNLIMPPRGAPTLVLRIRK